MASSARQYVLWVKGGDDVSTVPDSVLRERAGVTDSRVEVRTNDGAQRSSPVLLAEFPQVAGSG